MLHHLTNLAITQLSQLTVLIVVAGLLHRLLADRAPRLMLTVWTVIAAKAVTPPIFASNWGLFSWLQAPAVAGADPTHALLTVDWSAESSSISFVFASAVTAWAAGAVVIGAATWIRHRSLLRLIQRDALSDADPLVRYARGLAEHHGLKSPDRIVVSQDELGPAVAGVFRQTVLLPASLVDDRDPTTLRPVLLHELVHVTRRDTWSALLHATMRIVWWFNPLVWWASRRAESLVERCVDLTVTRDLQTSVVEYGRGLLRVLELRAQLQPQSNLAGLKPCQITTERLHFLSKDRPSDQHPARSEVLNRVFRCVLSVVAVAVLLPALPVDALTSKCDPAFAQGCPLEAAAAAEAAASAEPKPEAA